MEVNMDNEADSFFSFSFFLYLSFSRKVLQQGEARWYRLVIEALTLSFSRSLQS